MNKIQNNIFKFLFAFLFFTALLSCNKEKSIDKEYDVKIMRDSLGIPHIYANDSYSLFYGYGYAVAQDRLFQMEMIKRSTNGSVSEVLGKDYLQFDMDVRTNIDFSAINKQYESLKEDDKAIFKGYAKGINKWIDSIKTTPKKLLPKQFIDFKIGLSYWSPLDIITVFVGTMCNRYSDFTTEIQNLQLLQSLEKKHGKIKANKIFNQLIWKHDSEALTTIFEEETSNVSKSNTASQFHQLKKINQKTIHQVSEKFINPSTGELTFSSKEIHFNNRLNELTQTGVSGSGGYPSCSNMIVVGKNKAKNTTAIILNGPQFGWFTPSYVYGVGLHGAGYNVIGNTPFAYPAVLFGANDSIGWGATAGFGDMVDVFEEQLNTSDSEQYYFKNEFHNMNVTIDTIRVKNEADYIHKTHRTKHGQIIAWDKPNNTAYSKKRSWAGSEIQTLMAWLNITKTKNHKEWLNQTSKMAISINWYYADKKGNIGYVHTGKLPKRHKKTDFRLPTIGDGTREWDGFLPFSKNPQVYNPKSGYIANWNNSPRKNYNSPDMFWLQWGKADRIAVLDDALKKEGKVSSKDVENIMKNASFKDVNYEHFMPLLQKYIKVNELSNKNRNLFNHIKDWNTKHIDDNNDRKYDGVGYTIFKTYLEVLQEEVFKDDLPMPFFNWYASAGYRQPGKVVYHSGANIQPGVKVLYNILSEDTNTGFDLLNGKSKNNLLKDALSLTHSKLSSKFKTEDTSQWYSTAVKNYYLTSNFLGIPQANKDEVKSNALAMNRGTENNLIVFTEDTIEYYDVISPGQSGFISPDGKKAKHYQDQLKTYEDFEYNKASFSKKEVKGKAESIEYLNIKN